MKRREFITLLGGAAVAWPVAARAQQPAKPVIGFLDSQSRTFADFVLPAFRQGLKDNGYVEGDNVAVEYRFAENQIDRLPALAAELVRLPVALIIAGAPPAALAAKAATTTIPIVFGVGDDPVKIGLVTSLARPGGNLTGINFFSSELAAKRMELVREMVPAAARVAMVSDPTFTLTEFQVRDAETAARAMGLQLQVLSASTSREINAAFANFVRERPDALYLGTNPFFRQPTCPIDPAGGAPRGSRDIFGASIYRGRRADELRNQPDGCVSSDGCLYRPHPQGREAGGLAGRAVDQVRAGHQSRDRQDARPHRARQTARCRRRRDRITLPSVHARCWICSRPVLALRDISLLRIDLVAFGAKRTNRAVSLRPRGSKMTPSGH